MNRTHHKASGRADSFVLKTGRQAGVCLHFTSLPGPHGCGDIGDAAWSFIDRLADTGIGVWQFLPTGPTSCGDSPYLPLSVFAGNATLIGLDPLVRAGLLKKADLDTAVILPQTQVDYERAVPARRALIFRAAEQFRTRAAQDLQTAYEEFLHLHEDKWLHDYALFRILKALQGGKAWPQWDKPYRLRNPNALHAMASTHREAIGRVKITQFLFNRQWRSLQQYAAEKGICLFGDMPIYIALDSADAWTQPELLQLDADNRPSHVAGVPPDYFSADGQLWGNPLYDWDYHKQTGYRWWTERMRHATERMSIVRIDHFRGFESFWSVPAGAETARAGTWQPGPGDALFDALLQSLGELAIVAEDLGVITPEVRALRLRHGIPGMRVLQFEISDPAFDPAGLEKNCVCYTGTHDNDTTVGWFHGSQNDTRTAEEVLETRRNALRVTGGSPQTIHLDMIRLAFASPAVLAVAPMQDYLGLGSDARLNTPGTTGGNWRWRVLARQLQPRMLERAAALVAAAGRGH